MGLQKAKSLLGGQRVASLRVCYAKDVPCGNFSSIACGCNGIECCKSWRFPAGLSFSHGPIPLAKESIMKSLSAFSLLLAAGTWGA